MLLLRDQLFLLVTSILFPTPVSPPGWSPCCCLLELTLLNTVVIVLDGEGPPTSIHLELHHLRSKPQVTGRRWCSQDIFIFHLKTDGSPSSSWLMPSLAGRMSILAGYSEATAIFIFLIQLLHPLFNIQQNIFGFWAFFGCTQKIKLSQSYSLVLLISSIVLTPHGASPPPQWERPGSSSC